MDDRVTESGENWIHAGKVYRSSFIAPFEDLDDVGVVLPWCDLETCLERTRLREDPIDEAAVHVIWREFVRPAVDLVVDVTETAPEGAVTALLDRFDFDVDRTRVVMLPALGPATRLAIGRPSGYHPNPGRRKCSKRSLPVLRLY